MIYQELNITEHKIKTPFPLINAVSNNLQEGNIYNIVNGNDSFFIIHKAGFSYLSGYNFAYSKILDFFIETKRIPTYFHIYDCTPQLISSCEQKKDQINIRLRKRLQLKFTDSKLENDTVSLPRNYKVAKISEQNFDSLSVFNLQLENKFWKSKEDFIQNGFGFCVFDKENSPVSICYSACIADNVAEIDVATLPEQQKKGFGKMVVREFVRHCLDTNTIANWDCFEDNHASVQTAQSIGFSRTNFYNFLSVFNKARNHETR